MCKTARLKKMTDELNEIHHQIKAIFGFDRFGLENVLREVYDYFFDGDPKDDPEMLRILEGLKKDLPELNEEKINGRKDELNRLLKRA